MNAPDAVTSIVDRLALVPAEADAALVLRHAEREAIPEGTFGEAVPLTARGVTTAEQLGVEADGTAGAGADCCQPSASLCRDRGGGPSRRGMGWRSRTGLAPGRAGALCRGTESRRGILPGERHMGNRAASALRRPAPAGHEDNVGRRSVAPGLGDRRPRPGRTARRLRHP